MKRFFDAVSLALALALIVFAVWAWPLLPDQIPAHFGIDGRPDAWSERSIMSWFLLPIFAVLLVILTVGVRALLSRKPQWVSLPGGDKTNGTGSPPNKRI